MINIIKKVNIVNDIYCDLDNQKMVYYINDDLNIGFVFPMTNESLDIQEIVDKFVETGDKIFYHEDLDKLEYVENIVLRVYLKDPEENVVMLYKINLDEDAEFLFNENIDFGDDVFYTDDIIY